MTAEERRAYHRQYYLQNKRHIKEQQRANYERNKPARLAASALWRQKNKDKIKAQHKHSRDVKRLKIITYYGGKCACCGEEKLEFLAIDHINGGGAQHLKKIGGGYNFYRWLDNQKFPPNFRVLCHNCNMARGMYGYCPHERITT